MLKVIAEVSAAEEKRLPRSDDVNTMMAWREEALRQALTDRSAVGSVGSEVW